MRVLQMIDSLKWGGAQKMQVFLAESLQPLGIDLSLVSLRLESNSSVPDDLRRLDVKVHTFDFPRLFSPVPFFRLVQFIRQGQFDVIHAHLSNANIIGTLAGRLCGVPVIASLRSSGLDQRYQRPTRVFLENQVVSRGANRIMANGWAVGEFAERRYRHREIDILPNAIDPIPPLSAEERKNLRLQLVGDASRPLLLSVGRLAALKGFPDLINAFSELHKSHPQCALAIAGDGKQREELTAQIQQLHLTGHVFLLGVRNDVSRLMSACDLYVNSSHLEGLPVSVLEAMAAGRPVVATRVGDIPYVIEPGTGIVVEPNHPEQITQALRNLLDHPEQQLALGAAALNHIRRNFNRRAWRIQLLTLYTKVTPAAVPILKSMENS
jgi:glycosyltransferase involved in cell wall biosynthesis